MPEHGPHCLACLRADAKDLGHCPYRGLEAEPPQPLPRDICCVHGSPGCATSNGKLIDWTRRTPLHDDQCCMAWDAA